MIKRGKFITFEGIDGAGKSTHIDKLNQFLCSKNITTCLTREPGGTSLGESLRTILLHQTMHAETEALLMFAARREHIELVIEPALQLGQWVISDRFSDASFAYQGGGKNVPWTKLEVLEQWVHPKLEPDVTFLFDIDPQIAKNRINSSRTLDKFEQEKIDFFNQVRQAYLKRAQSNPKRFKIIDGSKTIGSIRQTIKRYITQLIEKETKKV